MLQSSVCKTNPAARSSVISPKRKVSSSATRRPPRRLGCEPGHLPSGADSPSVATLPARRVPCLTGSSFSSSPTSSSAFSIRLTDLERHSPEWRPSIRKSGDVCSRLPLTIVAPLPQPASTTGDRLLDSTTYLILVSPFLLFLSLGCTKLCEHVFLAH